MRDLVTRKQAAAILGISERGLKRHDACGTGPAYVRLGRLIRYRAEDIENWIAANRNEPVRAGGAA